MTTRSATLAEIFAGHVSGFWGKDPGELDRDVRIVRNGDVLKSGEIRWDEVPTRSVTSKEEEKCSLRTGDLLLTTSGNCARVGWVGALDSPTCASNFTRRLRPDPALAEGRYLFHLMNGDRFRAMCAPFIRGTTMENLSVKDAFAAVELPLPPIEDQRRVVAVLDAADELRAKRRQALAKLDTLSQGIFMESLTDVGPTASLGAHLLFLTSGARGWAKYYSDSGARFVRSLDVRMNAIGEDDIVFVQPPETAEARRIKIEASDVLLTITGSRIGRAAEAPMDLAGSFISQHVAILRTDPDALNPAYLSMWLSHSELGQRQIAGSQYGQTKPGLNFEQIRGFVLPVPSLDVQMRIMDMVASARRVHSESVRSESELDNLFASLQQRAFRGEL